MVYPEKLEGTPHHVHSASCELREVCRSFFRGIPPSTEKLLLLFLII